MCKERQAPNFYSLHTADNAIIPYINPVFHQEGGINTALFTSQQAPADHIIADLDAAVLSKVAAPGIGSHPAAFTNLCGLPERISSHPALSLFHTAREARQGYVQQSVEW